MHTIAIEGMRFYSFHGVFEEERIIGSEYCVDLWMETDFILAAETDDLQGTIDYAIAYEIVKKEMNIPSALIEHVGQRILNSIKDKYPQIIKLTVKVSKINPPISGGIERVSICISA